MFSETLLKKIDNDFEDFVFRFSRRGLQIEYQISQEAVEVQPLLKYLYANAPLSDAANYPYELFLEFANHGLLLWMVHNIKTEQPIPEDIFLDYVVYHRVNTEDIRSCRPGFYKALKPRIKGKGMREAILETNYWCAEEATYQSTDDRTISAAAVFESGIGRCGEESVFAVNALRSVGIPARQVYAHRWAHCDDNHAWVEAWCDGQWQFLGACEPEEILNLGWFVNASSRAMMINSRLYGHQAPQDAVIEQEDMTRAVSQLSRYAVTTELALTVTDEQGRPLSGAKVRCALLNYAYLVPIAFGVTDDKGQYRLTTGKGSLLISAWKDGKYSCTVVDVSKERNAVLALKDEAVYLEQAGRWYAFDMMAPLDAPVNTGRPTAEQKQVGEEKLNAAVAKRQAKVARFCQEDEQLFLKRSRGNRAQLEQFLSAETCADGLKNALLSQLSEKDFRDCKAADLVEHLEEAAKWQASVPADLFDAYVLNPRISIEQLGAYRRIIREAFSQEQAASFRADPQAIWSWIEETVEERADSEYRELLTMPGAAMESLCAGYKSKQVLFVAICRTFGIPARLNPVDGQMEYAVDGVFTQVEGADFGKKNAALHLHFQEGVRWTYMQNWSVSVFSKRLGDWILLQPGEAETLAAAPGLYQIVTTNRLPNGNQFAQMMELELHDGETKEIVLEMRSAELSDMLEEIPLEPFRVQTMDGQPVEAESLLQGSTLFIWNEVRKEPTEHILNELREQAEDFAKLSHRINLIVKSPEDLNDPTLTRTRGFLPDARVWMDPDGKNVNTLARRMYGDPDKLPLILVIKDGMKGIYSASGYNVGTGDMLLRILNSI